MKQRTRSTIRGLQRRLEQFVYRPHPAPVFVLGNQKSGTTAIASLIAAASGLSLTGDFFFRGTPDLLLEVQSGKRSFQDILNQHPRPFSCPIVKDCELTFLVKQINHSFPSARHAFVIRDPRSNIRSILNRVGLAGREESLRSIRPFLYKFPFWRTILEGDIPSIQGENHIEILAKRWQLAVEVYLAEVDSMELIVYEDFCANKQDYIAQACERLLLDPKRSIGGLVEKQFQPAGDNSKSFEEFFGAKNLEIISTTCHQGMEKLGLYA